VRVLETMGWKEHRGQVKSANQAFKNVRMGGREFAEHKRKRKLKKKKSQKAMGARAAFQSKGKNSVSFSYQRRVEQHGQPSGNPGDAATKRQGGDLASSNLKGKRSQLGEFVEDSRDGRTRSILKATYGCIRGV